VVFPRGSNGGVSRAHHEDESAAALLRDSGTTSCFSCRQRARGNGGEGGGSGVRALLAKEEGRGERGRGERPWQRPFKGEWREAEEKGGLVRCLSDAVDR
jgi:hypothetical protein